MKILILALTLIGMNSFAAEKSSLYSIDVTTIAGKKTNLQDYKNKVLLIVNTASGCGFTPQYLTLQALHEKYESKGLVVLGFPSNDFGKQEPGTDKEIRYFCESNYKVTFPMFTKASVKGDQIQPIFKWLIANSSNKDAVAWNFEKFLVGKDGKVRQRFKSKVTPDSKEIADAVNSALAEK